jgi:hypothetical protein
MNDTLTIVLTDTPQTETVELRDAASNTGSEPVPKDLSFALDGKALCSERATPDARDIQSCAHEIDPINTGEIDASVPTMCPKSSPSAELAPAGRDERGRFTPGNVAALKHGARRSPDAPDLAEAIEDERSALVAHVGGAEALTPTLDRLVRATARVAVLEDAAFNAMLNLGGLTTAKGKRRAIFDVWDRLDEKLAKRLDRLGLDRKTKRVTVQEHFATKGRETA